MGQMELTNAQTLLYLHGNGANVAANVHQVVRLRKTGLNIFSSLTIADMVRAPAGLRGRNFYMKMPNAHG